MATKKAIKVSVFLDEEMATFIDENKIYGMRRSDYMRGLVWEKMKRKKVKPSQTSNDPFANAVINENLIPNDLEQYAQLICEWWPIRYKKKATCSRKVAERIFDKLRTFTPKDRKKALEGAIAGGWMNIYEIKESKFTEEPKNNHPQNRVFTAKGGFQ
tara:strand:+ start:42 stop:515 length:474 start_codon:yes stop_codon:yes gene_type:complete